MLAWQISYILFLLLLLTQNEVRKTQTLYMCIKLVGRKINWQSQLEDNNPSSALALSKFNVYYGVIVENHGLTHAVNMYFSNERPFQNHSPEREKMFLWFFRTNITCELNSSLLLSAICLLVLDLHWKSMIQLFKRSLKPCSDLVPVLGHSARALKWTLFTHASVRNYKCS